MNHSDSNPTAGRPAAPGSNPHPNRCSRPDGPPVLRAVRAALRGVLLGASLALAAQDTPAAKSPAAPAWNTAEAVRDVARVVEDRYAVEATARRYAAALRDGLAAGRYAGITQGDELARRLTADLQAVQGDRHLRVRFSPDVLPPDEQNFAPPPEEAARFRVLDRKHNGGWVKVEVLPGNVGYLDFRVFGDPEVGAPKVEAAMQFVADTDALIIDLRRNGGATHPGLMDLLTRYLQTDAEIVPTKIEWRGTPPSFMTDPPKVPLTGQRYLGKPVYLLTSGSTFSGAEAFAYELQATKRATIVGDRSGGGANPGGELRAGNHFAVWVPFGHAVHPLTGKNWEGVGVQPDLECRSKNALNRAHLAALDQLLRQGGHPPEWEGALKHERAEVERQMAQVPSSVKVPFQLSGFDSAREVSVVGSFNDWSPRQAMMQRQGDRWQAQLEVEPGRHEYKFWVDGEWLPDPANPAIKVDNQGHTNSVLQVSSR